MFFCISIVLVIYYYLKNNEQIIPSQKCDSCFLLLFWNQIREVYFFQKTIVLSAVFNDKVQESMFDIRDKLAKHLIELFFPDMNWFCITCIQKFRHFFVQQCFTSRYISDVCKELPKNGPPYTLCPIRQINYSRAISSIAAKYNYKRIYGPAGLQ